MKSILRLFRSQTGSTVSFVALLGILWLFFAPSQISGPVTYVMVDGNSMEPGYHKGDLILARTRREYHVEDIVVYEHPEVGPIFHRIVDREGEQFTLKGDNNDWLDTYHPTSQEIFGKLWLHIPSAGGMIAKLRTPLYLAIFSLLVAVLIVLSVFAKQEGFPRQRLRKGMKRKRQSRSFGRGTQEGSLEILLVIGVFLTLSLILGAFAFTRPSTLKTGDDLQYQHTGQLVYSAQDTGDVYDAEKIQAGEPVFLALACQLELAYEYDVSFPAGEEIPMADFQGNGQMLVKVEDPNGWNRTLSLMPSVPFSGSGVIFKTGLDLCQVRELITHKEEVTGVTNRWYNLVLLPEISIQGDVGGKKLQDTFAPAVKFQLDSLLMRLVSDEETDPLLSTERGVLPGFKEIPNTLSILGVSLPVTSARWISGLLFFLALGLGAWMGWPVYQAWQRGDASRIQIQYSPLLIDIREESLTSASHHFVELVSFRELAKLAERYGAVILHEMRGRFHRYLVQDGDTVYQYALDATALDAVFPDFGEFKHALRQAINDRELQLYYQPIVSLATGELLGAEALLRWTHPQHGIIYPAEFIERAEEGDLIAAIDDWVLDQVCHRAKEWHAQGISFGGISVNVSSDRFSQSSFVDWLASTMETIGCDPHCLQLEINRANVVSQDEMALKNLRKLKEMGLYLTIDNFATIGANRIDHLSRMPVQCVKIDRSVIQNPQDNLLVDAVVKMAQSLDLKVVAQGVETEEQLVFLKQHAIDAVQGYFLSRPVPAEELVHLLAGRAAFLEKVAVSS
ncbi:MAG: putative signaling protein [Chloroflexi bacterium]|nr:putative signaling protein [Chloroflexota bacterium]